MMIPDWAGYVLFRPLFAEVIDERYHTLAWLDRQVLDGKVQFWRSDNAAMITEIRDYPTGAKDIHGLIAAGALEEITTILIPAAEQWARDRGCIAAQIESREGWGRVMRGYGYHPFQLTVRKELTDGAQ